MIDLTESLVADNCVTLVWRMPDEDSKIDHYVLEYRRTNFEGPPRLKEDQPWMVVEGIRQTEYTLTGEALAGWGLEPSRTARVLIGVLMVQSPPLPLTHPFIHSLVDLFINSPPHSHIHPLIHS